GGAPGGDHEGGQVLQEPPDRLSPPPLQKVTAGAAGRRPGVPLLLVRAARRGTAERPAHPHLALPSSAQLCAVEVRHTGRPISRYPALPFRLRPLAFAPPSGAGRGRVSSALPARRGRPRDRGSAAPSAGGVVKAVHSTPRACARART